MELFDTIELKWEISCRIECTVSVSRPEAGTALKRRAECPAKYDEVTLCIFGEKLFMNDDLVESMQWLLELRDSGH